MNFKIAILALSVFVFSCKNEPKTVEKSLVAPSVASVELKKYEGDCNTSCAEFNLSYPAITTGSPALRDSVNRWVENRVRDYSISSEEALPQRVTVEQAAAEFIAMWKTNSSEGSFSFESRDTVLACTPQFVTLRLDFYVFTGGAHPNYFSELGVFNALTGQMVPMGAFIKDKNAILPMLDIAYRAEKKEAFADGNSYEGGQISFPMQCAFTEKGVLFHYNTYELGSYALGDADIFLTWTDLGAAAVNPVQ